MRPDDGGVQVPEDDTGATRGSVRSGMGFAASSFVVNAVVGFVSAIITARLYGVRVIGEYALVTAPWLLLIQLSSMSEQKALTRELATMPPKDPRATALFVPVLAFSVALTAVVAVPILVLGAGVYTGPADQSHLVLPALALVAGYVVIENTSWNIDAVLAAFLAGRELFWARLSQAATFPAVALLARPVDRSVWALTIATIISFALALVVRLVLVRTYLPLRTSRPELRAGFRRLPSMLGFALRLLPSRIAGGITQQAGLWILAATSSIQTVGAYARANSVAVRLNDAGYRVSVILFPALVERHAAADPAGFRRILGDAQHLTAAPLLLGASVAGGVAAGVLDIFGAGFDDAANALAALLVAYALFVVVTVQAQAILAVGAPGLASLLAVCRAVVSVTLMVPFAMWWGGTGIAIALLLGIVQSWQLQGVMLRRRGFGTPAREDLAFSLGAAASSGAAFAAARVVHLALEEPLATIAGAVAGSIAFAAVATVTGFVRPSDRQRLVELVTRRRRGAPPTPAPGDPRPDASHAPSP